MDFDVEIDVKLKEGLLNPEAKTIERGLQLLGYKGIKDFDTKRAFAFKISAKDEHKARTEVDEMCKKILVNPVIQDYEIKIKHEK